MREVLSPTTIRFRGGPDLARDLAKAARRDKLTFSEFARRELRNIAACDATTSRERGPCQRRDRCPGGCCRCRARERRATPGDGSSAKSM
jgi:hypothetical protein